jgi:hypothetical protein
LLAIRNAAREIQWLTVAFPEAPDDIQLLLKPNDNPSAKTCPKAIFDQGIPATAFAIDEIQKEYARMKKLGAGSFSLRRIAITLETRRTQWRAENGSGSPVIAARVAADDAIGSAFR